MLPHWDTVICPFLSVLDEGPIVEIGAARGETTKKLAELAGERGLTLHSIDPAPRFDVADYEQRFGEHFRFHRESSFDALERIGAVGAAIVDGDHNWYTVHGELTRLGQLAASAGRHFPVVMLHDVEWPYARRDMYYDPDAIPVEWRNPWARRGIKFGESLLEEASQGHNHSFANAIEEGGRRNGVLTAVEDFIEESALRFEWRIVRGGFGIGILVSDESLATMPAVRAQWDRVHSTAFLLDEAERLSTAAMTHGVAHLEAMREIKQLRRELEIARSERA